MLFFFFTSSLIPSEKKLFLRSKSLFCESLCGIWGKKLFIKIFKPKSDEIVSLYISTWSTEYFRGFSEMKNSKKFSLDFNGNKMSQKFLKISTKIIILKRYFELSASTEFLLNCDYKSLYKKLKSSRKATKSFEINFVSLKIFLQPINFFTTIQISISFFIPVLITTLGATNFGFMWGGTNIYAAISFWWVSLDIKRTKLNFSFII